MLSHTTKRCSFRGSPCDARASHCGLRAMHAPDLLLRLLVSCRQAVLQAKGGANHAVLPARSAAHHLSLAAPGRRDCRIGQHHSEATGGSCNDILEAWHRFPMSDDRQTMHQRRLFGMPERHLHTDAEAPVDKGFDKCTMSPETSSWQLRQLPQCWTEVERTCCKLLLLQGTVPAFNHLPSTGKPCLTTTCEEQKRHCMNK